MDDASNDDNNSSLAPDTRADRSLPSEPAPQVIFVSGDMGPLLCVACGSPIGGDETESTATIACPGCGQHDRVVRFWKLYKAMISIDDQPLRRVEVRAQSPGKQASCPMTSLRGGQDLTLTLCEAFEHG